MKTIFFSSEENAWGWSWKCRLHETRKSRNLWGSEPSNVSGSCTLIFSGHGAAGSWCKVRMPAAKSDITWRNLSFSSRGSLGGSAGSGLLGGSPSSPSSPSSGSGGSPGRSCVLSIYSRGVGEWHFRELPVASTSSEASWLAWDALVPGAGLVLIDSAPEPMGQKIDDACAEAPKVVLHRTGMGEEHRCVDRTARCELQVVHVWVIVIVTRWFGLGFGNGLQSNELEVRIYC